MKPMMLNVEVGTWNYSYWNRLLTVFVYIVAMPVFTSVASRFR